VQHKGCKGSLEKWSAEELVAEWWLHQWRDKCVVVRVLVMPAAGVRCTRLQDGGLGVWGGGGVVWVCMLHPSHDLFNL
jgi:hypothetical protein